MKYCFFFNVYKDEKLAERLMRQLFDFYPEIQSICIVDGVSDLKSYGNTKIYQGKRLKQQNKLGEFIKRNFSLCLEQDADIFISLDPDTYLWKKFENIPEKDWFGQVNLITIPPFKGHNLIVGACAGYSRKAINTLLDSQLLEDKTVNDAPLYNPPLINEVVPAEDYVIGWALETLGFIPYQWEENSIRQGLTNKQKPPYKYSATHPVKAAIDYSKLK
jgi:hypothetical protein